jgi:hypothetical protein
LAVTPAATAAPLSTAAAATTTIAPATTATAGALFPGASFVDSERKSFE